MFDILNGSSQLINLPTHFSGKSWGVYVDYAHLIASVVANSGSPYTSWTSNGLPVGYIPIMIDNPSDKFDVFGKPLGLIDLLLPQYISPIGGNSIVGCGDIIYKNTRPDVPEIIPIASQYNVQISLFDMTTGSPLQISGTIGNQIMTIAGINFPISVGIICLKFVELNVK